MINDLNTGDVVEIVDGRIGIVLAYSDPPPEWPAHLNPILYTVCKSMKMSEGIFEIDGKPHLKRDQIVRIVKKECRFSGTHLFEPVLVWPN